jgi:lipopolysaccharide/colanic/teichoic acid biosynthesis glycosyltransferase
VLQAIGRPGATVGPVAAYERPAAVAIKRLFDLIVASLALLALLPLLVVLAVLIYVESPGGPFFVQTRVGQYGKPFRLFKLRTMVRDAERRRAEVEHLNESKAPLFKCHNDPRVTRLGRILRATSLDELPQLLNVVLGDMSLVGPRPRLPAELAGVMDRPDIVRRLEAKPGLAGVWQVSGRANNDFEAALKLDLYYLDHWSFRFDLQLIVRTFLVVVSARGAC